MTSTDVGVEETGGTPIGESLQKIGTGNTGTGFTWSGPSVDSPGDLNAGQTISPSACAMMGMAQLRFRLQNTIVVNDPNLPPANVSTALRDAGVGQSWIPAVSPENFVDDVTIGNVANLEMPVTITYSFFPRLRVGTDPNVFCDGEVITVTVQINPTSVAISCPADVDYGNQCSVMIPDPVTSFNLNMTTNPELPNSDYHLLRRVDPD